MDPQLLLVIPSLLIFYGCYHLLLAALIFVFGYRDKKQGITIGLDDDQNFSVTQNYGDMSAKCQLHVPNIPGWIRGACSQVKAAYKLYAPTVPGTDFKPCLDSVYNHAAEKCDSEKLLKSPRNVKLPIKNHEFAVTIIRYMADIHTDHLPFSILHKLNKNYKTYDYDAVNKKMHEAYEILTEHIWERISVLSKNQLLPLKIQNDASLSERTYLVLDKKQEEVKLAGTILQKLWLADMMLNSSNIFQTANYWCNYVRTDKYYGQDYSKKEPMEEISLAVRNLFSNPFVLQMFPELAINLYSYKEHDPTQQWIMFFEHLVTMPTTSGKCKL